MKKKIIIITIVLISLALFLFFLYIFRYQQIVNEGSEIYDDYCLKVNPLIIARKNAYLDGIRVFEASGSTEQYLKTLYEYKKVTKEYLLEENKWFKKQDEFTNRWDFKLLAPKDVQRALFIESEKRKNEDSSSEIVLELFNKVSDKKAEELLGKMITNKEKLIKLNEEEEKLWNAPLGFDIRDYFIRIPDSICPDENFNIPDVNDVFTPSVPANEAFISS